MRSDRSSLAAPRLFGLAASFDSPEAVLAAARELRAAGYRHAEAYTPFPVTGLSEALGFRRTWIPPIVLTCGLLGAASGFFMQWFANVIHYPLNVGGRPPNSWPMFIPITFELAVLFAGTSAVVSMIVLNKLPQLYHPMFKVRGFTDASRDRFFICVESRDDKFDPAGTRAFLEALHPVAVLEVPR